MVATTVESGAVQGAAGITRARAATPPAETMARITEELLVRGLTVVSTDAHVITALMPCCRMGEGTEQSVVYAYVFPADGGSRAMLVAEKWIGSAGSGMQGRSRVAGNSKGTSGRAYEITREVAQAMSAP